MWFDRRPASELTPGWTFARRRDRRGELLWSVRRPSIAGGGVSDGVTG